MSSKTKYIFLILFLSVLLTGLILYFSYDDHSEIAFYAVVEEVNAGQVLLAPFSNEEIAKTNSVLSAYLVGLKAGQIVKVTAKSEIKETYPAMIDVVSYQVVYELKQNENVINASDLPGTDAYENFDN